MHTQYKKIWIFMKTQFLSFFNFFLQGSRSYAVSFVILQLQIIIYEWICFISIRGYNQTLKKHLYLLSSPCFYMEYLSVFTNFPIFIHIYVFVCEFSIYGLYFQHNAAHKYIKPVVPIDIPLVVSRIDVTNLVSYMVALFVGFVWTIFFTENFHVIFLIKKCVKNFEWKQENIVLYQKKVRIFRENICQVNYINHIILCK